MEMKKVKEFSSLSPSLSFSSLSLSLSDSGESENHLNFNESVIFDMFPPFFVGISSGFLQIRERERKREVERE